MGRPSSIDKLPEAIQGEVGRLRIQGATIDEILAHLRGLVVNAERQIVGVSISRSALGRHITKFDIMREKMKRTHQMAIALYQETGDVLESKVAQANIQMLHAALFELMNADPDGDVDADGVAALKGNPEGLMMLARMLKDLILASKNNVDFLLKAEERAAAKARTEAAKAVEAVTKARGISAETAELIKAAIFGVKTEAAAHA